MEQSTSHTDTDVQIFLQPPDRWPTYDGYLPLKLDNREIRILYIEGQPGADEIHARLEHVSLTKVPAFHAISYYWGSPDQHKSIKIGGQTVHIRATLYAFLSILCHENKTAALWLDALCINQRDNAERSQQVAMMSDIYRNAIGVKTWIGNGDPDTDYALGYLKHRDDPRLNQYAKIKEVKSRAQQALLSVGRRPYWNRLWVLQELALARSIVVYCGQRSVSWTELVDAVNEYLQSSLDNGSTQDTIESLSTSDARGFDLFLHSKSNALYITPQQIWQPLLTLNDLRTTLQETGSLHFSVFEQVFAFHQYGCVDMRDKIFGLLSLAAPETHPTVDYTATFVEVFSDMLSQSFSHESARYLSSKTEKSVSVESIISAQNSTSSHQMFASGFQTRLLLKMLHLIQVFKVDQEDLERSLQCTFNDRQPVFSCISIGTVRAATKSNLPATSPQTTRSKYWDPNAWLFAPSEPESKSIEYALQPDDEIYSLSCHGREIPALPHLIVRSTKGHHHIIGATWHFRTLSANRTFPLMAQAIARGHIEITNDADPSSSATGARLSDLNLKLKCTRAFALAVFMTYTMEVKFEQPYENVLLRALRRPEVRNEFFSDEKYRWGLSSEPSQTEGGMKEIPFQLIRSDAMKFETQSSQVKQSDDTDWTKFTDCLEREYKLLRSGARVYVPYPEETEGQEMVVEG